ncbi:MAG: hypothetical protein KF901_04515 [Myxococcales bacterium]|nr:hypothetical protein [Myxococcales bacterium]
MSLRHALLALAPLVLVTGCRPDLGECNENAARQVVFLGGSGIDDGLPLYAGQAMTQLHCGNGGFCHSPAATGAGRAGAPAGLDFDVALACPPDAPCCTEASCEAYARTSCNSRPEGERAACQMETFETQMARVRRASARLAANQEVVFRYRHDILRTLRDGSMPPGAAGQSVRPSVDYYREFDGASFTNPLPEADTPEGREIIRNWLACGSPVLEASRNPGAMDQPGARCMAEDGEVGLCAFRAGAIEPPDPTWNSIYDRIVRPLCLDCHRPGNPFFGPGEQELDYSDRMGALTAMLNVAAEGSACADDGDLLISPGSPMDSVFYTKMTSTPTCGDIMPLGRETGLPDEVLAPIRQWITAGANP